jgi:protein SCO1/2
MRAWWLMALLWLAAPALGQAPDTQPAPAATEAPATGAAETPATGAAEAPATQVGVDEHLGRMLPLDLTFLDEEGRPVRLGDLIDRPTILTLVYYRCPSICTPLLSGLVDVVERSGLAPDRDFRIVTISFDETETPDLAARKKMNFLKAFHEPFPPEAWRFLTGDKAAIDRIADAIGFRFQRVGQEFNHPGVITIVSPRGKVARYLYGITFLPFDLKMALNEAAQGKTGPTINRVLYYCFSYDPDGQRYVFDILKVAGTVIMVFAAVFVLWLVVTTRRARRHGGAASAGDMQKGS